MPSTATQTLLRYSEIALKGKNRANFEQRLILNTRQLLQRELGESQSYKIKEMHGRLLLDAPCTPHVTQVLEKVFGLSSFSPAVTVKTDLTAIEAAMIQEFETLVQEKGLPKSFRITTKRSDKAIDLKSPEIDRALGSALLKRYPDLKVDLKNYDVAVGIEIRDDQSYIWIRKIPGPGGLPVGSSGKILTLLSGGIDSPVAAIHLMKRGARSAFVHFFGTPFVDDSALQKVEDLARIVSRYSPFRDPLFVVKFGKIQETIAKATGPKFRTVLYRRMMMRIAAQIARRWQALALVTGESLGQVASQTLHNMSVINSATSLPILRPLIGFDKDQIIQLAHQWNTYDVSIRPAVDCCTLFADRHPVLYSNEAEIEAEESLFSVDDLVQSALEQTELKYF